MTDTTCAHPYCDEELPELAVIHADPFCSVKCCNDAHGIRWLLSEHESFLPEPMARLVA